MERKRALELPDRLDRTRQQFERWRGKHKHPQRIPEELWASAVELAGLYGVHRTARALRLNYQYLQKHMGAAGVRDVSGTDEVREEAGAAFVELMPSTITGLAECIVELEDRRGARMKIQLKGGESPDLAALTRSFWGGGR